MDEIAPSITYCLLLKAYAGSQIDRNAPLFFLAQ